jgi:hypothetical protein
VVGDCDACLFWVYFSPRLSRPMYGSTVTNASHSAAWTSYDKVFKPMFGDGERTIGESDENLNEKAPLIREAVQKYGDGGRIGGAGV